MSKYRVIGHDKSGFVVKDYDTLRVAARATTALAKRTSHPANLIRAGVGAGAVLMTCSARLAGSRLTTAATWPVGGKRYAACRFTKAGRAAFAANA